MLYILRFNNETNRVLLNPAFYDRVGAKMNKNYHTHKKEIVEKSSALVYTIAIERQLVRVEVP